MGSRATSCYGVGSALAETTTTVHDVLRAIRNGATGNRDRGTRFEELMVQYLSTDPQWTEQFTRVWMWADWPGAEQDKRDTGIDLVAQDRETGGFCAIQCKFYEPHHTVRKEDIDSFFTASGKGVFTRRMIISTTDKWSVHAEEALDDQQILVTRIGLSDIANSAVEWHLPAEGIDHEVQMTLRDKKSPRPHQKAAIDDVFTGFAEHDRGKLIMACGTGKTFTSLKIAERLQQERAEAGQGEHTTILFLVPSIALLSQSLREWSYEAGVPLRAFAVCSDAQVGKQKAQGDDKDMSTHDLALPATTSPDRLIAQMASVEAVPGLTVVFSTYQSIATISAAQKQGLPRFDLVLCDEAHRTTGVTLSGHDESAFVRVHDDSFIGADRRLYMTATPRVYSDDTKQEAKGASAAVASMDNEAQYGPEFHRLGFGKAVEQGLLTDYKVLILTIDEGVVAKTLQEGFAGGDSELRLDDAAKIIGCWNALAKRTGTFADGSGFGKDEAPMKRAVAFSRSIADSKAIMERFNEVVDAYDDADDDVLHCEVEHVDGTFNTLRRNQLLDWLKQDPGPNNARILSNARCLSEGVDVPSLDAVLFLNPRNSVVDVVQSVGRVMRVASGKNYGYIILPVAVPAGVSPEKALADNQRFKTVWQVLQALRAHDDRFNATVNQIELNKKKPDIIGHGHIGAGDEEVGDKDGSSTADSAKAAKEQEAQNAQHVQDTLFSISDWREAIYARIVDKVGERHYWEDWAKDIAQIADRHVTRIEAALEIPEKKATFEEFVGELRATINPGITGTDAIDMLAQHIITKPVFDALFKDYAFAEHNPVSKAMQRMLDVLDDQGLDAETKTLEDFYHSVRVRAEGIDNHQGRQRVIVELYEKFFKTATKKAAEALGIVYTPVEVVDFIIRATEQAMVKHLGRSLSDEGVHILDPFVGTGTFPVRLLQSGLITQEDLLRKYSRELHANEIVLLAYYIAAVNIEAAYMELAGKEAEYQPFEGIVLADTFQLAEGRAAQLEGMDVLAGNSDRAKKQKAQPVMVVIGNPPYSAGQESQNDDNQNVKYETLDTRIQETYAAKSTATNKNSLYDSYIRAIRWASDRIEGEGVVAFVSNGGYIDGNTADGLRKSLVDEFDAIYCYNLRGNQRTAGEQSRKEGGKIFGSGSRNTVAILILVKGAGEADASASCVLHYRDIGDYLSREDKLRILDSQDLESVVWERKIPNADGDWINQRDEQFAQFQVLGDKDKKRASQAVFETHSSGLKSGRDAWVYNFSKRRLTENVESMIDFYNGQVDAFAAHAKAAGLAKPKADAVEGFIDYDATRFSWNRIDKSNVARGVTYSFDSERAYVSAYRPFTKQHVVFDARLNDMVYQLNRLFPKPGHPNVGFYMTGLGALKPFSVLMVRSVPDLNFWGSEGGQFFPRYTYVSTDADDLLSLATAEETDNGYRRVDNITDAALTDYRTVYDDLSITKDDVFHYTYALLHSPEYRDRFAADLKKSLPRIPKVRDFRGFAEAGRRLADLHLHYEQAEPYKGIVEIVAGDPSATPPSELYRVAKMKIPKVKGQADRSTIVYNTRVKLTNIPEEAYRYQLGARSAIEWIIDRYQVKVDKASEIVNDPNDWSDDPRYIIDLLKRIVTVSLETMKIVDSLPALDTLE
ncbi:DEAD/DEAH box helicase family protein [Streptomyces sp. ME02-6978a]|uniref:DEAD/DEAH box helicase n=1 Tax=unclassified Streptomyces TaxID=2593676 RepID=UPI0029BB39FF|nr:MULTISPECIES: type ISP restriction/modification enzyme [unclassified Streptomyces]MDX3090993.1 DEAD/DEAH box helicase family protein [Streptomyces sp. ME12-02E]MDX3334489.1 DEAD/DEAH box helicase family protein [Streptomyces sp. ME02-6978a]